MEIAAKKVKINDIVVCKQDEQLFELGQVSELTLGLGGSYFEGLRYIWLDIV